MHFTRLKNSNEIYYTHKFPVAVRSTINKFLIGKRQLFSLQTKWVTTEREIERENGIYLCNICKLDWLFVLAWTDYITK